METQTGHAKEMAEMPREPESARKFSVSFYFRMLTRILSSPARFYKELKGTGSIKPAFSCLVVSSVFFAGATMTQPHENALAMAGVGFANAIFMCFMTAFVGYGVMIMTLGRRVTFAQFFSVQAFAVSVTLLAAWIPLFIWITEPWKWCLIGVGLVKACGFRWYHAVMNISITIFVMVLFFWSTGPLIVYVKG